MSISARPRAWACNSCSRSAVKSVAGSSCERTPGPSAEFFSVPDRSLAQVRVPRIHAVALERGELKHLQRRIHLARITDASLDVEWYVRQQVNFVEQHKLGRAKHMRILERLVLAFGNRNDHHSRVLAEIEQRRTNEVADIFDHENRSCSRVQPLQRIGQHRGVEMTSAAGIDLNRRASGGADSLRVERSLLIALDDADRNFSAQLANRTFQQRSLAGARRAHQVEGHDLAAFQPSAVVLGEVIVFGEDVLLELKRTRRRMFVRMLVIVMMLVSVVRVIMMMVAVLIGVMGVAGVVRAGEKSQTPSGAVGASAGGTHFKLPRLIESSVPVH